MALSGDQQYAFYRFIRIYRDYVEGRKTKYGEPPSWEQVKKEQDQAFAALAEYEKRETP